MMATRSDALRLNLLFIVFLLSGMAALIYQVCWQRMLFTAFGVDIESITIIVSVFMCGLGLGALAGGRLADRYPERIVHCFALFELCIGLFGAVSPLLIAWVAQRCILWPEPLIAAANFLLLLLPTCLMGATLPMLTRYLYTYYASIGTAIGNLYFINTVGASLGAIGTGMLVFVYLDLHQTVHLAALLNFSVAMLTFLGVRK